MDTQEYIQEINKLSLSIQDQNYEYVIQRSGELIQLVPDRKGAYLIQAQAFIRQDKLIDARDILQTGRDKCGSPELTLNLAIIYSKLKDFKKAYQTFKQVDILPDKISNPQYWFHFGMSAIKFGQINEGINHYKKVLDVKPDHKAALNNLANILHKKEERKLAEKYYLDLIKHHPGEAMAYSNLAGLYEQAGKKEEAADFFKKAIQVDPTTSIAYYNLGQIYCAHYKDFEIALNVYDQGLKHGDSSYRDGIRFNQILARQNLADWSCYEEDLSDLNRIIKEYLESHRSLFEIVPYTLSYFNIDPKLYRKVAERYANKIVENTYQLHPDVKYDHSLGEEDKIKIGYLSPNFRLHPGGTLVRGLFDYHDSKRFETHAFSLVHKDDFVNRDIRDSVDYYHNASSMTSVEVANLINRTGIDILVSLAGYNSDMKFDILALRPAPIQMIIIGSHETTGADFVDYIFTDEFLIDDEYRQAFSEKLITLPCSLLLNSALPLEEQLKTNKSDHGLPDDQFVFANFNHPKKLDPGTFKVWMQILQKTPDSVLWLYNAGNIKLGETLKKEAEKHTIDPARIIMADPIPIKQHWERFRHADLFLDSFNYNAHVTGIEALRMGIPIVTLKGNNHNRRLCSSLLHYSGLKDLICNTKIDYITVSSQLASNAAELEEIKIKLQAADNKALFDTELQAKYLEKAYLKALLKFKKGQPPGDIVVGSALDLKSFI